MSTCTAIVSFLNCTNCFAHVNRKFSSMHFGENHQGGCVKLIWENNSVILWCVDSNILEGCVGLNSMLAQRLNISEGTVVLMSMSPSLPILNRVTIMTNSDEDYCILASNIDKLQHCLLDQAKVLVENQNMVLWVSPSMPINVKSKSSSLLKEYTELAVLPADDENKNDGFTTFDTLKDSKNCSISYYMQHQTVVLNKYNKKQRASNMQLLKVSSVSEKNLSKQTKIVYNCLYVPENYFAKTEKESVFHLQTMNKSNNGNSKDNVDPIISTFVKLKPFNFDDSESNIDILNEYISVVFPEHFRNKFSYQPGDIFILDNYTEEYIQPEIVELSPIFNNNVEIKSEDFINLFRTFISAHGTKENPLIINSMDVLELNSQNKLSCQIEFHPKSLKYILLNGDTVTKHKVVINENKVQPVEKSYVNEKQTSEFCRNVQTFEDIIENCTITLKADLTNKTSFKINNSNKSHILILGPSGSGKTTLANIVVDDIKVWSTTLDCRSLKGRKDVIERFQKAVQSCEERLPSVLICNDIECLFPRERENLPNQDLLYYETQANAIKAILHESVGVITIVTSTGIDDSFFKISKGDLLFLKTFTIPELMNQDRVNLMKYIITSSLYKHGHLNDDDFQRMSLSTSGMTVRDLVDYSIKNIYKIVKESVYSDKALSFTYESDKTSTDDSFKSDIWDEVGGLLDTKKKLTEIICWPIKYPGLFAKQPGAILLFGPPGTGKSLIGYSLSKLNNISFIRVKGPELLSKYIGQSEQSVRNLFKRAEKKKPCIIFFDEFDSLAPRRGHDSTGVTDRVVNQLLTQLDGVEGSVKGVTVIAASSRPDLLDGALLRPGRFDTYIHCSLPNKMERLEIFKIFSSTLTLANDVNLEELSQVTENYTGADIKSILSTAQLTCIEEQLMQNSNDEGKSMDILITKQHLLDSLNETRPSLSPQQILFYERTYERFFKKPTINDVRTVPNLVQRATLA